MWSENMYTNGTKEMMKVPTISHFTLSSLRSTYLEKGSCMPDLVIRNKVLANPAAKMVPPTRLSLMKIAKIGAIRPKPVKMKISESINSLMVRFMIEEIFLKFLNVCD